MCRADDVTKTVCSGFIVADPPEAQAASLSIPRPTVRREYRWASRTAWIKFSGPRPGGAIKLDDFELRLLFALHRNSRGVRFIEES